MSSILQKISYVCGSALNQELFEPLDNDHQFYSRKENCSKFSNEVKPVQNLKQPTQYPKREEKFGCDLCTYLTPSEEKLKEHLNIHFLSEEKKKKNIQKIKKKVQNRIKCDKCYKTFVNKNCYNIHCKTHDKVYQFQCTLCPRHFHNEKALISHQKLHNMKNVPTCSYCSKVFSDNSALKIHIRLHTGEKPFTCKHCNISYSNSAGLLYHKRLHHLDQYYFNNI